MQRKKNNCKNGKLVLKTDKAHDNLWYYLICIGVAY